MVLKRPAAGVPCAGAWEKAELSPARAAFNLR
jgi:hypothetical protein